MALQRRRPKPGLIHHSDQGSQYASHDYLTRLKAAGLRSSMRRRGDCWDNAWDKAVAESFFASLEKDLLREESFVTRDEARRAIFDDIEGFYNPHRIHSTIGCMSPIAYEANWLEAPDA